MAISISVVLLLGIVMVFLLRKSGLRPVHAVVCVLLGFYLAGSSLAPSIHDAGMSFAGIVNGIHF